MKQLRYIEIKHFKTFEEKIRIELGHPAVLIGPNNAGKTSVIQALALWNRGIQAWYDKKGQLGLKDKRERISAGINRLHILEIPVSETRFLWTHTRVRRGNTPIEMTINVGLEYKGKVFDCRPCPETVGHEELLEFAAGLRFSLLYPMSGIEMDEPLLQ
jgi:predicted ATP-dependent endonuclease of OLD family